jgi:hypothetical protein
LTETHIEAGTIMVKAALALIPFEKESALKPDSPALSTDVYNEDDVRSVLHDTEIAQFPPQIICSPKRTGKTTLAQHICSKQQQISLWAGEKRCIEVPVEFENGASEMVVRKTLAQKLQAPSDTDTLPEMLRHSKKIKRAGGRAVVTVRDADNISNPALRWLLYNVRQLYENPSISGSLHCQILIDGSFALESITTPDSEFPLPQIYPYDFAQADQFHFVNSRFSQLNISLSDDGCNLLWESTRGDKYLTQALCLNLLESVDEIRAGLRFNERDVSDSIERFVTQNPEDEPLKMDWINSFIELSSHFPTHEFELSSFLKTEPDEWDRQSDATRIAYQGGIVRRTSRQNLGTRPFVRDMFEQLRSRATQVRTIIDTGFAPEAVADDRRAEADELVKNIMKASYLNQLRTLHVGPAVKISDSSIEVDCHAWGQGAYRGTWQVTTDSSIKVGDELWAILWAWEQKPGRREGKVHTFPVKPVI